MPAAAQPTPPPARDRILAVAFDLFYRQGYLATGVNQIIAESGVAKASFYGHFPAKELLLHEYLRETARRELAEMRAYADAQRSPRERFYAVLKLVAPWFEATNYRGCPLQNAVAEAPDADSEVRKIARQYREDLGQLLEALLADLIEAEPQLANINRQQVVQTYQLLLEGAIVLGVVYRQPWPLAQALRTLELCLPPP